jgi:hypothetical protein
MTATKISGKGGRMKHLAILSTAVSLSALSACALPPSGNTNCPNVAVLEQASSLTAFLPGRQDVAAEITQAQVTGVAGSCTLEKKSNVLRVTFQAGFSVTNGPANTNQTLVLPYIVSQSQDDTILSMENYSIPLTFNGNASTAAATSKPITLKFPNNRETQQTEILVGFHLTQDELNYNASHQGQ